MKKLFGIFAFIAAIAAIDHGLYKVRSQAGDPVSVSVSVPDVIYGLSTGLTNIPITAMASSTAGRIVRVEIYRDDVLIATITNIAPESADNLRVTK